MDDIIDLYEHIDYERSYHYTKQRVMTDPFYIRKKSGASKNKSNKEISIYQRRFQYIKGDLEFDISNIEILNKLKIDNIYTIRRYQENWNTGYYFYNLLKVKVLNIDGSNVVLEYLIHDTYEHNIDCNFTPEHKRREINLIEMCK